MARPVLPKRSSSPATLSGSVARPAVQQVSGNRHPAMAGSAQVFRSGRKTNPGDDRNSLVKAWQREAYRHAEICGEARYSAALFSNMAGRAEIGVSEPQAMAKKATWVTSGPEVAAFAELVPTVRDRAKLIRDFMLHWTIAGECYLIARKRTQTDPGYVEPPVNPETGEAYESWDLYLKEHAQGLDVLDPEFDPNAETGDPNIDNPLWEVVAVTEIRKTGETWSVRHDNANFLDLHKNDPVIRMWNPNPENRREAWSPFMAMESTLREIEWLTKHIFTQVRSRLMAAGVWFLPDNLTFAPPPTDAVEGGDEAIAEMNEAERFMVALAAASMDLLDGNEVAFPSVVMADPIALAQIDQKKLIQFWSELDDKAMIMRSDAVRRFALGMDLPPEQVLGSSGLAVTGAGGSAGSVNHWGVWANEEQTISGHIEPALDAFTGYLTTAYLQVAVEGTTLVIAYDTVSLRLRQDRSEEAIKLYDRGLLKGEVTVREVGFDPDNDMMDDAEYRKWVLGKIVTGSFAPEQMQAALILLGIDLPTLALPAPGVSGNPRGQDGKSQPGNTDGIENRGTPKEQHDHTPAPFADKFTATAASAEALVLRAIEKNGNRLLNEGKRGRDRDRTTPPHLAHVSASLERTVSSTEFDFSMAPTLLSGLSAPEQARLTDILARFCADLTNQGTAYSREGLIQALSTSQVA